MYKCIVTGRSIGPNVPANRVILQVRPVRYTRILVNGDKFLGEHFGWEIVKEGFISPAAAKSVPTLEMLLARLKEQKLIDRTEYIAKRPKNFKRKPYQKRDHRITSGRLTIIKS